MPTWPVWQVRESLMRTKTFRPYDQDSLLLMPPSVRDWVDPGSLPAFIDDLVEGLDLRPSSPPTTSPGACRPTTRR
jgi:hypothetical protein